MFQLRQLSCSFSLFIRLVNCVFDFEVSGVLLFTEQFRIICPLDLFTLIALCLFKRIHQKRDSFSKTIPFHDHPLIQLLSEFI